MPKPKTTGMFRDAGEPMPLVAEIVFDNAGVGERIDANEA
jgi:hypothetical protein